MKRTVMLWCIGVLWGMLSSGVRAEVVLTVAETASGNFPTTQGLLMFAEIVKEWSQGEIRVEVKYGGLLGRVEKNLVDQVQFGSIDLARVSATSLSPIVPAFQAFEFPYLWHNRANMWAVLQGEIGQALLKELETGNCYGLGYYETGARSFYNARREIKTVADLQGLNVGVPKNTLLMEFVQTLGATPIPMAPNEIYDGIQKQVIDGAENHWLVYEAAGHYEVAKYYTLDQHTRVPSVLIASKVALEKKLKPEQIALLKQAAQATQQPVSERWQQLEDAARKTILSKGNVITELTPEALAGFVQGVQPFYQKYGARYKVLINEIRKAQQ